MRKLGFDKEFFDTKRGLKCFSYNLKTYNNKRTWNNAEGGQIQKTSISIDGKFIYKFIF